MRKRHESAMRRPAHLAMLAAVTVVATLVAGCDSRVEVRGPKFNLPTVPSPPTVSSGPTVSQSRPIAGVSGVTLEGVGYAQIAMGASESLIITAPESLINSLTSDVVGGQLVLGREFENYTGQASDIRFDITLRHLDELVLDGVGQLSAVGVDADRFSVRVSGVGEASADGRADRQEVRISGVASYIAPRLESRITNVNLHSGRAVVWASERIEGWVAFGSTLEYWGDPEISIQGGGSVSWLGSAP